MAARHPSHLSGRGGTLSYAHPARGSRESGPLLGFATLLAFSIWLLFFSPLVGAVTALIPGSDSLLGTFAGTALRFIPLWMLAWYVPRLLGRPSITLLRPAGRIQLRWFGFGFGSWLALSGAFAVGEWLLSPEDFTVTVSWSHAVLSVFVALIVFPIQTSAEELVFRGLIPQALGTVLRSDWAIAAASGLLFAVPHLLNPEAIGNSSAALIAYGALGAAWCLAVLRTGGLEVALGAHLANNIFALSIVGYENSALPSIALWTTPAIDLSLEAGKSVVAGAIWVSLVHLWSRKNSS